MTTLAAPLFRRWRRDCHGAAAVEFALVSMFLVVSLMGIMELGMIYFVSSNMEGAVRDAARYGTTGQTPAAESRAQYIVDIANNRTLGLLSLTTSNVTTKVYGTFAQVGQPEQFTDRNGNGKYDPGEPFTDTNGNGVWDADQGISSTGSAGQIVVYTISYDWPLMFGYMFQFFGGKPTLHLSASDAIRNEPYAPTS